MLLRKTGKFLYRTGVILIDCERCRFDLERIFSQIDGGLYSYYPDFLGMSPTFLQHHPYKIGELDPRWNSLDYWDRETKAIHYTDLSTQPWKYHNHPYGKLWFDYFQEAIAAGYISRQDIHISIERAYVRRDIMQGNFSHKSILRHLNFNLGQFADKVRTKFNL
jgi:hypothetical protein